MKKVNVLISGLLLLLFSVAANAQTKPAADYFPGQWNISGTEAKTVVTLERKEGKLSGTVKIRDEQEVSISRIVEEGTTIAISFKSNSGYGVDIQLVKKDENNAYGTLYVDVMGTNNITAERILKK
jgi:hypothetical protein